MENTARKIIESIGLSKCEFNNECDFCNEPEQGSYARLTGYDSSEIAYHICGKCALEKIKSGIEHCEKIKLETTKPQTK